MLTFNLIKNTGSILVYEALLTEDFVNEYLCKCTISVDLAKDSWTISQWYANKNYQHKGYGRMTMKALVQRLVARHGLPNEVIYIWNHANQYVYDWIYKNFDAKLSDEAIKVLKYSTEDVKEGHEYYLNPNKFFKYFGVI